MDEYKKINYFGTDVYVTRDGKVRWNNSQRNIYYNHDGYSVCAIKVPNKGWRSVRVARLVAMAYIPNPYGFEEVNHKDYDRTNSSADNLEWVTHADNVRYSKRNMPDYHGKNNPNYGNRKLRDIYAANKDYAIKKQGRPGLSNGRCKKMSMFKDGVLVREFPYIAECCRYLIDNGYSEASSVDNIRGQINKSIKDGKTYKGFVFVKE